MTSIHFNSGDRNSWRSIRSAVSLHGHTCLSRENLSFVGAYVRRLPFANRLMQQFGEAFSRAGPGDLDVSDLWWHPPLPPREAFRLETDQIQGTLDIQPLVSITDHDEIAACRAIQLLHGPHATPVSLEWTVPAAPSFVHLGVHNLPPARADCIYRAMLAHTSAPDKHRLAELLAWLNEDPGTLIVLNHPLWDEANIGAAAHKDMVRTLLASHGGHIHAVELNGLRPWRENEAALALSREAGLPAVSGGDRHGTEPSTCLNLTCADSFQAFVHEVRREKRSTILFMPRYACSHRVRHIDAMWDLVRDYPEYPGRVRWTDRAFVRDGRGLSHSLSSIWRNGDPLLLRACHHALRLLSQQCIGPALRLTAARRQHDVAR